MLNKKFQRPSYDFNHFKVIKKESSFLTIYALKYQQTFGLCFAVFGLLWKIIGEAFQIKFLLSLESVSGHQLYLWSVRKTSFLNSWLETFLFLLNLIPKDKQHEF